MSYFKQDSNKCKCKHKTRSRVRKKFEKNSKVYRKRDSGLFMFEYCRRNVSIQENNLK